MTMTMIAAMLIAQAAGASSPHTRGYPECDKFIQMVTECIRTKVPPSDRADKQQELDAFRKALMFVPEPARASACAENIKLQIQRDRYGCYAAQAAQEGMPTPCSLVTRADLQLILGSEYTEGQPGSSKCTYASADGAPRPVTLEVRWTGGREELANARASAPPSPASRTARSQTVVAGRTIEGIGDDAFLIQAGLMPMLHVQKGDAAVIVTAPLNDGQLAAIARTALQRMSR